MARMAGSALAAASSDSLPTQNASVQASVSTSVEVQEWRSMSGWGDRPVTRWRWTRRAAGGICLSGPPVGSDSL